MAAVARSAQLADWALTTAELAVDRRSGRAPGCPGGEGVPMPRGGCSEGVGEPRARLADSSRARVPSWGAPPGLEFVDLLAAHLGVDYYVGWLSAFGAPWCGAPCPAGVSGRRVAARTGQERSGQTRLTLRIRPRAGKTPVEARETRMAALGCQRPRRRRLTSPVT